MAPPQKKGCVWLPTAWWKGESWGPQKLARFFKPKILQWSISCWMEQDIKMSLRDSSEKISEALSCLETSLHSRRNKVASSLFFKMYTSRNLGICDVLINNPGVHPYIILTILVQITECAEKPLLIYLLWADLWELLEMTVNDEFPGKGLYSTGDTGGPAKCL